MKLPKKIEITEVGPRDGFQNIKQWIQTEDKLEIMDRLIKSGFTKIEATAFVNPKVVPQMSDATEIIKTLKRKHKDVALIALAPNLRGVHNALEAGVDEVAYIVSASERHNFENTRQTIDQSLRGLAEVCRVSDKLKIRLAIPTAFNCPWTGRVPHSNVIKIIYSGLSCGVSEIGLGDTIGSANPLQVKELLDVLKKEFPNQNPVLHFHDTRGMGMANVVSALQAGATKFESSIGGLGGCPFAPGAAGNIATEDLVNMLHEMNIATGIDMELLMDAVNYSKSILPVPLSSNMVRVFHE